MKVHKVVLLVIDSDNLGADRIKEVVQDDLYPNHCIGPLVMSMETREVEWSDDHALNKQTTMRAEFDRLFPASGDGTQANVHQVIGDGALPPGTCFSGHPCRFVDGTVSCADCDLPRAYLHNANYSAGIATGAVLVNGVPMRTITDPSEPIGVVTIVRRNSQGPITPDNVTREAYTLPGYAAPTGVAP